MGDEVYNHGLLLVFVDLMYSGMLENTVARERERCQMDLRVRNQGGGPYISAVSEDTLLLTHVCRAALFTKEMWLGSILEEVYRDAKQRHRVMAINIPVVAPLYIIPV